MLNYFNYVLPKADKFFLFHFQHNFRGLRFTSFSRKKATLHELCMDIVGNNKKDEIAIGFGDWEQRRGFRCGHALGPIVELKTKVLPRYADVIEIREYNTSALCHSCTQELKQYKNYVINSNYEMILTEIYSLKYCTNKKCANAFIIINRDQNAAINMRNLLIDQENNQVRNEAFTGKKLKTK